MDAFEETIRFYSQRENQVLHPVEKPEIDLRVRYAMNVAYQREQTRKLTIIGLTMFVIGIIGTIAFTGWFLTWDTVNNGDSYLPLFAGIGTPASVWIAACGWNKIKNAA